MCVGRQACMSCTEARGGCTRVDFRKRERPFFVFLLDLWEKRSFLVFPLLHHYNSRNRSRCMCLSCIYIDLYLYVYVYTYMCMELTMPTYLLYSSSKPTKTFLCSGDSFLHPARQEWLPRLSPACLSRSFSLSVPSLALSTHLSS